MFLAVEIAPPFLVQAVAIVGAAALVAHISQRLGLVPIVGFLLLVSSSVHML
jgi:Kef-type K+ transport system membrane component KefB